MNIPADFGRRVKALREARDMNQRALAKATNDALSQSGIVRIEKGDKRPSPSELLALSWALGVSLDELTDEQPLGERKIWAARSKHRVDVTDALDRLTAQLQLRNTLQEVRGTRAS